MDKNLAFIPAHPHGESDISSRGFTMEVEPPEAKHTSPAWPAHWDNVGEAV